MDHLLHAEKSLGVPPGPAGTTHPIVADIQTLSDVEINFDGITYAKGASVLKQLVAWVGEEAFDRACAGTSASTRGATPSWPTCWPTSGRRAAGTSTPGRSLAADRRGGDPAPHVEVDEDGVITSVAIGQEAPP